MSAISLYARPSATFTQKLEASRALLLSVLSDSEHHWPITQASSLGVEDMVVTHLIAEVGMACSIFVLDTGMLHNETLALIGSLEERYGVKVDVYQPDPVAAEQFVTANGPDAMYTSLALRKACCDLRKMAPLARALSGKKAWITGLRREQSSARAEVHAVESGTEHTKINPLADWTQGDIWHFVALHNIPYNPLHDAFFPSIGCAPCTRAVTLGEDPRSGRWWWEQQGVKECGLHVCDPHAAVTALSRITIKEIAA